MPSSRSGSAAAATEDMESFELRPLKANADASSEGYSSDEDFDLDPDQQSTGPVRRKRRRRPSFELYTPDEERRVLRRLDRRLVLFLALLYMLSFLDRSNIGNARIAGMTEDLNLPYGQYEWLLTGFYITYVAFEWMTLLYAVLPAHVYISLCVAAWGLVASLQSVATGFVSLFVLRALLGIAEAGFGPGVPFYLSFFFRREELALRTGLFIAAAPLATSFASTLAWLIAYAARSTPFAPWRLLFLVEGSPSLFVALIAWHIIPDSPETASFLTPRHRKVAQLRLRKERKQGAAARGDPTGARGIPTAPTKGLKWREIGRTLLDPKAYITAMMFFSCNVAFSSLPPFLPTIINEMNYSALAAQALSAPPYIVAFLFVLLIAYLSDRAQSRSYYIVLCALVSAFGYGLLAVSGAFRLSNTIRYLAVFPAAAGFFAAITLIITWTLNNQASNEGKGTGMAMLNVIGQLGPLLGTRLYPDTDKPYYVKGMAICAGFMIAVAWLSLALRIILYRYNKKAEMDVEYVKVGEDGEEEDDEDVGPDPLEGQTTGSKGAERTFLYLL